MKKFSAIAAIIVLFSINTHALLITGIGPSAWASDTNIMNENLGIDATFVIEDFEDTDLIAGLQWSGDSYNILPTFDSAPYNDPALPGNWDGGLSLKSGNGYDYGNPSFSYNQDLVAFGIGITGQSNTNHLQIIVDGTLITETNSVDGLDFVQTDVETKNGYLWIVAEDNERFNTVEFVGSSGYQFYFDHAALKVAPPGTGTSVPEPGMLSLIVPGVIAIGVAGKMKLRK